ncbi:MAG: hypothetical protein RLZZ507_259 [Cyanobacteriota bacterium]|jgi:hypothetical protein
MITKLLGEKEILEKVDIEWVGTSIGEGKIGKITF